MRGHGWPLAALVAALLLAPSGAGATTVTSSFTVFHDSGAIPDPRPPIIYTPANAKITATSGSPASVSVVAQYGAKSEQSLGIQLFAPTGQELRPGTYTDALWKGDPVQGPRPGIADSPSFDCFGSVFRGQFEVKDLVRAPDGTVQRLWAVYEVHCSGFPQSAFGELRYNEPAQPGNLVAVPSLVRWPAAPAGGPTVDVPITVIATAPAAALERAVVAGRDAGAFAVTRDECAGRTLARGGYCQVWLHAAPAQPGERAAAVEVAGGPEAGLEAFGTGGETGAALDSDPGFPVAGVSLGPADASSDVMGPRSFAEVQLTRRSDGARWSGRFDVPRGQRLAPGHYVTAPDGPSLSVGATAGGVCRNPQGSFDVTSIAYDTDDFVSAFGVRFELHCDGAAGALRGTMGYRAADATPPARWMRNGPALPMPDTAAAACAGAQHLVRGGRRADRLRGTSGRDHVVAGPGRDRVRALGGDDCVDGGPGRDVLDCGAGDDVAIVTKGDRVRGCERAVRRL